MQKIGVGIANYFNNKYRRKGHLFNQFKAIHIQTDDQLKNVITYVHCNPISLVEPGWKEYGIKDPERVKKFLTEEYRWSSYLDYLGRKNFPSLIDKGFVLNIMDDSLGVKQNVDEWISYNKVESFEFPIFED